MGQEPFIDFYEILQISPRADQETIERVYRLLAKRYHPDNKETGNVNKFEILTKAFRALSDPESRAGYDANYEAGNGHHLSLFAREPASGGCEEDRRVYKAILSILYTSRRRDAGNPGIGVFQLERVLGVPEKYLEFHIWYLKEKGWIQRVESGGYAITAGGVDTVIENGISLKKDRLLPASGEIPSRPTDSRAQRKGSPSVLADQIPA